MKAKTIKAVLRKKLDAWLETIDDEAVRELAAKNSIVTGGCIASMLLKEKVNDVDVYFRNRETALAVARYYVKRFKEEVPIIPTEVKTVELYVDDSSDDRVAIYAKSAGVVGETSEEVVYDYFEGRAPDAAGDYISEVMGDPGEIADKLDDVKEALEPENGKPKYRPVFLSTNAITLANQVQLIIRFYGDPDQIHENYDFVHCTNYYDADSGELVLRKEALEALLARELRYVGSKYPLCSIIRVRKFVARGWTINAGQILKMCVQVSALDLTDFSVLRDQLTGVDVAYFAQVIQAVKEKSPEKVNAAYLVEIINRMF